MGNKNGTLFLKEADLEEFARTSGMNSTQVKNKFAEFIRIYPNGKVNRKNFKSLMSLALPRLKGEMEKLGNHIFRVYDSNNDGHIDFIEFMVVYHVMTEGSVEEILGKLFKLFDEDSDGFISGKEMKHLVKDLHQLIVFDQVDAVGKAGIARGLVSEMDKNSDGKISKDEFIAACLEEDSFMSKIVTFTVIDVFTDMYSMKNPFIGITDERNYYTDIVNEEDDLDISINDEIIEIQEDLSGRKNCENVTNEEGYGPSKLIRETSDDSGLVREIFDELEDKDILVPTVEDDVYIGNEENVYSSLEENFYSAIDEHIYSSPNDVGYIKSNGYMSNTISQINSSAGLTEKMSSEKKDEEIGMLNGNREFCMEKEGKAGTLDGSSLMEFWKAKTVQLER